MAAELHTEGLRFLLEVAFSEEQTVPANFYMGLAGNAVIAEASTLAQITEVTGGGYARQALASSTTAFTSAATGTNDWKTTTGTVQFAATSTNWTAAETAFLCTVISGTGGKLIASSPLSQTRNLGNGDTLDVSMVATLTG